MTVPDHLARVGPASPTTRDGRAPAIVAWLLVALHLPALAFAWAAWNVPAGEGKGSLTDFGSWYTAGQIVRAGEGSNLYDFSLQQHVQQAEDERVGESAPFRPFVNPPHVAVVMAPMSWLDGNTAYVLWSMANLALLACFALVTAWLLRAEPFAWRVAGAAATACGGAVSVAMLEGALSILCALGLVALVVGTVRERHGLAALGFVAAAAKPHFLILPVLAIVLQGRWRLLGRLALAGSGLVAVTALVVGPSPWLRYPVALLRYGGPGANAPEFASYWWNVAGVVRRLGGPLVAETVSPLGWITFAASIALVALAARRVPQGDPSASTGLFGLALLASIVFAAHANPQDAVVVMVVFAALRGAGILGGRRGPGAVLLAVAYCWPMVSQFALFARNTRAGVAAVLLLLVACGALAVALFGRGDRRQLPLATPIA